MPNSSERLTPLTQQMPSAYQIRVVGHLDRHWSAWFGGLTLSHEDDGTTTLAGDLSDQAALHGVLSQIRDLNLTLVALERLDRPACPTGLSADQTSVGCADKP